MRALSCSVYRNKHGGCTHGPTRDADDVLLVGEGVEGPWHDTDGVRLGQPVFRLVRRELWGKTYLHAIPNDTEGDGVGRFMFGGNFIHSCDSRFPSDYPIPVHDRTE